ncbi:hypothetical protein [Borrelia miyamotoi]|nr:hypothetical protein [Borrelia miyamotoi]AHH04703.1 hypothetical protein BOM_0160 [Borrelia miyamotoi FR64b]
MEREAFVLKYLLKSDYRVIDISYYGQSLMSELIWECSFDII